MPTRCILVHTRSTTHRTHTPCSHTIHITHTILTHHTRTPYSHTILTHHTYTPYPHTIHTTHHTHTLCRFVVSGSRDRTIKLWDLSPLFKKGAVYPTMVCSGSMHEKDINMHTYTYITRCTPLWCVLGSCAHLVHTETCTNMHTCARAHTHSCVPRSHNKHTRRTYCICHTHINTYTHTHIH